MRSDASASKQPAFCNWSWGGEGPDTRTVTHTDRPHLLGSAQETCTLGHEDPVHGRSGTV